MRHFSFFIISMLFVASAFAGEPEELDPDTVANIESPLKVIVTENGQKTEVKVEGTSSQPDYRFLYSMYFPDFG